MISATLCTGGLTDPVSEDPGEDGDPGVQTGPGVSPDQDGAVLHGPWSHHQESGEGTKVHSLSALFFKIGTDTIPKMSNWKDYFHSTLYN